MMILRACSSTVSIVSIYIRRAVTSRDCLKASATETMVPSACQGIVGVTARADDADLLTLLAAIEDQGARAAALAERALLAALDGSCRTPIAGYAKLLRDDVMQLTGLAARADGTFLLKRSMKARIADAEALGRELGRSIRADSPPDIFA